MKKWILLIVITVATTALYAQQANIAGKWVGRFGGQATLVFHFKKTGDSLSGTFDSPRENAFGIPLSSVALAADTVVVTVKPLRVNFKGKLTGDTAISGSWLQGAAILPITFIKTPELRPQQPVAPFNYNSEEVGYDNADKSVHFGGTFTYPKKGGPFVTAILITGSGQEDRDETIRGHKPFAVIADYLTKNGYAVLRVDDRGVGKTTGTLEGVTSQDFARDVEAAIDYVKSRKEVNAARIGLIGHSEGGLIANIVAVQRPADVYYIISLAGPGVRGSVLMAEQNEKILTQQGVPAHGVAFYKSFIREVMDSLTLESDSAAIYRRANLVFNKLKQSTPDSAIASLGIFSDMQAGMLMKKVAGNLAGSWMKYMITSDPAAYIEKLSCKYLALNGSEDVQVVASLNLPGIEAALKKSKSTGYVVKEIQGVNHLFQHCKLCTVAEYGDLEETFAPDALNVVTEWLNGHVK